MAQVVIKINSREYAIACDAGEEVHILQLSRMLEEKAKLLTAGGGVINENMLLAMIGLLLADELSELKKVQQTSQAPAPQPVAPVTELPDLSQADAELAEKIKNCVERIKSLAKTLEML